MKIAYRPGMTRRNARHRGPLESPKYITDVLERRYDINQLADKINNTQARLGSAVDELLHENGDIHNAVSLIERRVTAIDQYIKEVM